MVKRLKIPKMPIEVVYTGTALDIDSISSLTKEELERAIAAIKVKPVVRFVDPTDRVTEEEELEKEKKFKVGDVIMPLDGFFQPGEARQEGRVCGYATKDSILVAVSFKEATACGCHHDCGGLITNGEFGWFFPESSLSISAGSIPMPVSSTVVVPAKVKRLKIVDKDWQEIEEAAADLQNKRILLYGPPGTGKTTFGYRLLSKGVGEDNVFMMTAQEGSQPEELLGHWIPKGNEFTYHDGYGTLAFRRGALVINEPDHASSEFSTTLHAVLDDPEIARLRLPTGEIVRPHEGFRAFCSMNGHPDDLPEALRDRFDMKVYVPRPHPGAMSLLDKDLYELVLKSYSNPESMTITYRSTMSFQRMRTDGVDLETAAKFAFGEAYKDTLAAIKLGKV